MANIFRHTIYLSLELPSHVLQLSQYFHDTIFHVTQNAMINYQLIIYFIA